MPQTSLDSQTVREMLLCIAERLIAAEPMLSAADRDLGDGDHGLGMARGFSAVKARLEMEKTESVAKLFGAVGMTLLSTMGGASGALFGSLFRAGGKALEQHAALDAPALATFLEAAVAGVVARGGAKPGGKTMIDALQPAAIKARELATRPLPEALTAAANAAQAGAQATKAMKATVGRAQTLGEGSIGYPDPGALSVALILHAAGDFVSETFRLSGR